MTLSAAFIVQARRALGGAQPDADAADIWRGPGVARSRGAELAWAAELERAKTILSGIAPTTEETFLSIGANLQAFHESSQNASDVWRAAAAAMAGEEVTRAMDGLRALLDEMASNDETQRHQSRQVIAGVDQIDRIKGQVANFDQFARTLRVLGVSTRIESARLNTIDSGFERLSDDVKHLAADIETKAASIMDRADSLGRETRAALGTLQTTEQRQDGRARELSDRALASLADLTARHEAAARLASTIAARYDDIARCIGEVVAGLQFHDIARQRIEHVIEAVDAVVHSMAGETGRGTDVPPAVGLVSRLQAAQLEAARADLVAAVERVVESLRQVAHIVNGLSSETRQAAGVLNLGTGSFAEISTSLCSVREVLGEFEGADAHLSQVMSSVAKATRSMTAFMDDIRGIGQRMALISLNALIQAEHLGQIGAPLTVISEAVHQAARDTRVQTEAAAESLRSIGSVAAALTSAADRESRSVEAEEAISTRLDELIEMLKSADARCQDLSTRVGDTGEALSARILTLVESIDIHRQFSDAVNQALAHMEAVATASALKGPADDDGHLQALEARYTMDQEREIHQTLFQAPTGGGGAATEAESRNALHGAQAPAPCDAQAPAPSGASAPDCAPAATATAVPPTPAGSDAGLGDNVELF
jgi:hypothetical protein